MHFVPQTGMLPTAFAVKTVAAKVVQYGRPLLVVDPVMVRMDGNSAEFIRETDGSKMTIPR